jgi:hypothetical protein
LGLFLYTSDLGNVTASIATMMSNYVRSHRQGDNSNATVFAGQAIANKTFIHVRWAWLVRLGFETVLAVVLLGATIKGQLRRLLLKSSALRLLFHGIEGWHARNPKHAPDGYGEAINIMTDKAKQMDVKFMRGDNTRWRFVGPEDPRGGPQNGYQLSQLPRWPQQRRGRSI